MIYYFCSCCETGFTDNDETEFSINHDDTGLNLCSAECVEETDNQ